MSHRLAKINKHIQRTFGEILQRDADLPADVLVTIARVDTTPNLRSTTVWLYIFPLEQGLATLAQLKSQLYDLQGALNRNLSMRPLPRLKLQLDHGAAHAEAVTRTIESLRHR